MLAKPIPLLFGYFFNSSFNISAGKGTSSYEKVRSNKRINKVDSYAIVHLDVYTEEEHRCTSYHRR